MARNDSYFEAFLDALAEQMAEDPSPLDNPYQARLMGARKRENDLQAMRDKLYPGPDQPDTLGALLKGLGRIYGGGASLALTGNPDPRVALGNIWDAVQDPEATVRNNRDPISMGLMMAPIRGPKGAGAVRGTGRAGHGAEVREELLAKRKAKGPRKPGGGRRPAGKTKYPPETNQDLIAALAMSVPPPAAARKGGLSALLNRLGRRGGR